MMGLACWCHGPASAPPGVSQCVGYRFSLQVRFPLSSPSWTSASCCVPPRGRPEVRGGYELGSQSHLAALAAPCQSPTEPCPAGKVLGLKTWYLVFLLWSRL